MIKTVELLDICEAITNPEMIANIKAAIDNLESDRRQYGNDYSDMKMGLEMMLREAKRGASDNKLAGIAANVGADICVKNSEGPWWDLLRDHSLGDEF
ncbi:coil containing protein [Vibrio phage 1.031.O._10N.261.46.F8]|nr:coil containing protein [Vibrio phage 1.031.O._10N.261.46.F8]